MCFDLMCAALHHQAPFTRERVHTRIGIFVLSHDSLPLIPVSLLTVQRYGDLLFIAGTPMPPNATLAITGLNVSISQDAPLSLGVSENYTLSVPVYGVAVITADTQWGALRALESFTQLFNYVAEAAPLYQLTGTPVSIVDFPRWQWRGLLLDSSRHFLTTSAIKVTLDAMAYTKLNTMHWHIVDDNSWPLRSVRYPNFANAGAYAPAATYSHADIQDIVQYAADRGIRVVPELDMPAHADIWGAGYPELIISCPNGQSLLNPTDDGGVYDTVDGLLQEFVPLFKVDFIHFGGDEVQDLTCWNESAEVQAFMKSKGIPTVDALRNYFQTKIQNIALKYSLASMFWEEVYDDGYTVLPTSVVDIWLSYDEVSKATAAGRRIISSFGYYLDQQQPYGGTHYFWADTWQNFFLNDATNGTGLTPAQEALILGGSLSQWGEQVDSANIQSRIWPRAAGGAERFWSSRTLRDVSVEEGRLEHFRCHLIQRGIGAGPIRPSSVYGYCPLPPSSRLHKLHNF